MRDLRAIWGPEDGYMGPWDCIWDPGTVYGTLDMDWLGPGNTHPYTTPGIPTTPGTPLPTYRRLPPYPLTRSAQRYRLSVKTVITGSPIYQATIGSVH